MSCYSPSMTNRHFILQVQVFIMMADQLIYKEFYKYYLPFKTQCLNNFQSTRREWTALTE